MKKVLTFLFITILLSIFNCGDSDVSKNRFTIDGYNGDFSGYYKIDSKYKGSFTGNYISGDNFSSHFYFEKDLENFKSVKVFIFKSSAKCTVVASIWVNYKEVATVVCDAYEGYDEHTDTYKLAVDPLYYEWVDPEPINEPEDEPDDRYPLYN